MFKVAIAWDVLVPLSNVESFGRRAQELGLESPCEPSGSDLADTIASVLLAPYIAAGARFLFERCLTNEPDADDLAGRGIGQTRPAPDERLVVIEFVVRVEGDAEIDVRAAAKERYGVPVGENTIQLASAVDDELSAIPNPATDGLDFLIPDYWFSIVE